MNSMSPTRKTLYTMILTALFAAACFAGMFIFIPVGVSKIHLGNFFCILAGLLCGGLVGGLSGSLGMTLYDVLIGGAGPDTFIRTMIVKFLLGFVVGSLFRLALKKKLKIDFIYLILIAIFGSIAIAFTVLRIEQGAVINIGGKDFKDSLFLIILASTLALFYLVVFFFSKKLKEVNKYVLLAASIACTLNIVLEFILKIPFKMLFLGWDFNKAFLYGLSSLPAAILTTIITIVATVLIYLPVYYATSKFNKLDEIHDQIVEATTYKAK